MQAALRIETPARAHLHHRRPAVEHSERHQARRVMRVPVLLHLRLRRAEPLQRGRMRARFVQPHTLTFGIMLFDACMVRWARARMRIVPGPCTRRQPCVKPPACSDTTERSDGSCVEPRSATDCTALGIELK